MRSGQPIQNPIEFIKWLRDCPAWYHFSVPGKREQSIHLQPVWPSRLARRHVATGETLSGKPCQIPLSPLDWYPGTPEEYFNIQLKAGMTKMFGKRTTTLLDMFFISNHEPFLRRWTWSWHIFLNLVSILYQIMSDHSQCEELCEDSSMRCIRIWTLGCFHKKHAGKKMPHGWFIFWLDNLL